MSIYFLPSSPSLVSKDSNACFAHAISFCVAIRKFAAGGGGGGGMRNMNILLGDILLIFILYSFSK